MRKWILFISTLALLTACGQAEVRVTEGDIKAQETAVRAAIAKLDLNRTKGIRGEYAPKVTDKGVVFSMKMPEATLVTIAGSFNGWNPRVTMLTADNGIWTITLPLKKGQKYLYKFVVDGYWIADPDNPDTVSDGYGGANSVVAVK